jgi:hypothetical protein
MTAPGVYNANRCVGVDASVVDGSNNDDDDADAADADDDATLVPAGLVMVDTARDEK